MTQHFQRQETDVFIDEIQQSGITSSPWYVSDDEPVVCVNPCLRDRFSEETVIPLKALPCALTKLRLEQMIESGQHIITGVNIQRTDTHLGDEHDEETITVTKMYRSPSTSWINGEVFEANVKKEGLIVTFEDILSIPKRRKSNKIFKDNISQEV